LVKVESFALVDSLRDVGRLPVDGGEDGTALVIEADFGVRVADAAHRLLDDFTVIDVRGSGNFTGNNDQTGGNQSLASDAAFRVDSQDGVEHSIGDLIGNLVGMAFAHRLGGKEIFSHDIFLLRKNKNPGLSGVAGSGVSSRRTL